MSSVTNNHPYTNVTAQAAYNKTKEFFIPSKTDQVAIGWLWAIRIKAEVQSFFTKPVVLITAASVVAISSLAIRPVNLGLAIVSFIICVVASSVLGQAISSTVRGTLPLLSNHYAAIANLAKADIEKRNSKPAVASNNPFA